MLLFLCAPVVCFLPFILGLLVKLNIRKKGTFLIQALGNIFSQLLSIVDGALGASSRSLFVLAGLPTTEIHEENGSLAAFPISPKFYAFHGP